MWPLARLGAVGASRAVTGRVPLPLRCISTSGKRSETVSVPKTKTPAESAAADETPPFLKSTEKNWISYGFDEKCRIEDENQMNFNFFIGITVVFVFGGFIMAYRPDYNYVDWSSREAYLELRRREAAGLPPVDPDYVPRDTIVLPSDEELGDTEIII